MNETEHWERVTSPLRQEARNKAYSDLLAYMLHGTVPDGMVEVDKHYGTMSLADSLSPETEGGTPQI
jgi:hypothetical protein